MRLRCAALIGLMLWCPGPARADEDQPGLAESDAVAPPAPVGGGGRSLIRHRAEAVNDLAQAARLVKAGAWADALEIYAAVLREDRRMVAPAGGGRYVPVSELVQAAIGALPDEGLRLYRARVDPEADALWKLARDGDRAALDRLTSEYLHATRGADALELAVQRAFDEAEFARAARLARRWLEHFADRRPKAKPLLLLRLGIACVHTGRTDEAAAVLVRLRAEAPDAAAIIGGRRLRLDDCLDGCLRRAGREAAPAGGEVPPDLALSLRPRWTVRFPGVKTPPALEQPGEPPAPPTPNPRSAAPRPVPVLSADALYVREPRRIAAYNARSGRVVWAIDTPERTAGEGVEGPVFVGVDSEGGGALDFGRLTVSVADGRVFCLEGLASEPALGEWRGVPMGNRLTCRDAADGKQLWAVGVGAPAPPADCGLPAESLRMLAAAEFASAPAVDGDRLLVLAEYAETYHAVCLDARTGRPVWTRLLSSAPEAGDGARHPTAGSPPAVADGAAFFLTNAGVLAALDAAGGEPIWMMQYEERGVGRRRTGFPSAPLIAGGVVYALPTDAEHVLAVRADTGEAVWRDAPSRRGQGGLVGLTGGVLVLGGPDVRFVRAADGAVLGGAKAGMERTGRPALTRAAVYVPVEHRHGSRGVVRVSLPVGGTAPQLRDLRIDPRQQTGMQLGHLVVADGRLIAAGEDQLHAFFDLEEELRRLTAELAGDPENRQILLDRGGLSLSAGRLDAAEPDLTSARRLASAAGDRAVEAQARAGLFDLHFARADAADDPASRRRHLEAAREAGTDPVRTATVLLEMARAAFDAGSPADLAEAADRAQEIIAAADVRIDPADRAERRSRSSLAPVAAVSAHLKAHALVGGVIAAGGRKVYERHDRAADQALTSAAAAGDIPAMDEVLRSYPHGLHARRCRLELGMAWARRALAEHRKAVAIDDSVARLKAMEKVAETGHKALDHLRTIDASTADAHRPTALFVLTDLYIRVFATPKAARSFVRELSQLDAGTPIAWEDPAAPRRLGDLLPGLRRKVGIRDDDD